MSNQFLSQGIWHICPDQFSDHGMSKAVEDVKLAAARSRQPLGL
ncbi:hypothetical protein [Pseudomonas shahriarae]|nr:hypothetical protein [Pseudomonas shahriarae]